MMRVARDNREASPEVQAAATEAIATARKEVKRIKARRRIKIPPGLPHARRLTRWQMWVLYRWGMNTYPRRGLVGRLGRWWYQAPHV